MSDERGTRGRRAMAAVLDFVFGPMPGERLALFERGMTLTFLLYVIYWAQDAREWLTDAGYHVSAAGTSPAYPTPLPPLPEALLIPFMVLLIGSASINVIRPGWRSIRLLLLGLAVYLQLVDQPTAFTLNKLYIVFFFVLSLARSPRMFMDDDGVVRGYISAWPVRVIQATLIIQYFTAGISKAVWGDWLSRPDVLYTHAVGLYRNEVAALLVHNLPAVFWPVMAYGALAFELLSPVLFLVRPLRIVGVIWGVGFQLMIALMMKDLIWFSLQLISVYILFLRPDLVIRIEQALRRVRLGRPWRAGRARDPGSASSD